MLGLVLDLAVGSDLVWDSALDMDVGFGFGVVLDSDFVLDLALLAFFVVEH